MRYTTRHERKVCRSCGGHYMTGEFYAHVRGLMHRRTIALEAKIRRKKAREIAAWEAENR